MPPRIEIHVDERPGVRVPADLIRAGVRATLDSGAPEGSDPSVGASADGDRVPEISVAFVDDGAIRSLHRRFLDQDRPTDVLAFALHEPGEPVLGDVYVGLEQARRQTADSSVPLDEELLRLAIHGTLHVLGHDHPEGPEREESPMYRRQEALVRAVLESREADR